MGLSSDPHQPIRIFFFPYLARGHIIPLVNAATLFAGRGATCTVVTTPANASYVDQSPSLHLLLLPFPSADAGLPAGVECTDTLPSGSNSLDILKLFAGIKLLFPAFHGLLALHRPDCVICDPMLFFCWPPELAAVSLSIPHFHFCTTSPFANAVSQNLFLTQSHHRAAACGGAVMLQGLPHALTLDYDEIPIYLRTPNEGMARTREAEKWCKGILFNTFYELASEYVDHVSKVTLTGSPMQITCIGPVPPRKKCEEDEGGSWGRIKKWLDMKDQESVFYVSFGSECALSMEQMREIAVGLASCRHSFIWVVRGIDETVINSWLPEDFSGLILTEWAPQVAILNHPATGGYVLHCGWNSTIEAVCAGLPVIAWPVDWEQFLHERLVVEVLKIGMRILEGPKMRAVDAAEKGIVKGEVIREAVDRLMGGEDEEAKEMRRTAKMYKEMARSAMEEGGSSYVSLGKVIEEIKGFGKEKSLSERELM